MTVNCSASVLLAAYLVVAERQGVPWERVSGTIQNDMLKEYIAQKEWICPTGAGAACRYRHGGILCKEGSAFSSSLDFRLPHPRGRFDCGSGVGLSRSPTASATCKTLSSVGWTSTISRHDCPSSGISTSISLKRLPSSGGAPDVGALDEGPLRRKESTFADAPDPCPDRRRFTDRPAANQQRGARGASGNGRGIGRGQSMHTNSMDETLALPTEQSVMVAVRTQQIIAEETGVTNTIEPLAGVTRSKR